MTRALKLCLVTSSGGHLVKTMYLREWWQNYQRFWVTRDDEVSKSLLASERVIYGHFPENRNMLNLIRNFFLAVRVLTTEKPTHLFSTGAGIAFPFFVVAKILGVKTIFMETFITIDHPTLTGRLLYHLTDAFIVQQPSLLKTYPKATYVGGLWQ